MKNRPTALSLPSGFYFIFYLLFPARPVGHFLGMTVFMIIMIIVLLLLNKPYYNFSIALYIVREKKYERVNE